jgi:hypothetical protein
VRQLSRHPLGGIQKEKQMVDINRIYKDFVQQTGSCILASYAIASNYFTAISPSDYFRDYQVGFNLNLDKEVLAYFSSICYQPNPSTLDEFLDDYHFRKQWSDRKISGLNLMAEVHKTFPLPSFRKSFEKIALEEIPNVTTIKPAIEESLQTKESLLIAAFGGGDHIAVFGFSKDGYFTVETRPWMIIKSPNGDIKCPNITGILPISNLNHFGELGDALLLSAAANAA